MGVQVGDELDDTYDDVLHADGHYDEAHYPGKRTHAGFTQNAEKVGRRAKDEKDEQAVNNNDRHDDAAGDPVGMFREKADQQTDGTRPGKQGHSERRKGNIRFGQRFILNRFIVRPPRGLFAA